MKRQHFLLAFVLCVSACQTAGPPVARRLPHFTKIHGDRLVDNYYWLRKKDSPAVLAYLKAEDAYTDAFIKPAQPLQEALYKEMLGHIQETDSSVPYRDGDWLCYHRTEEGEQYPIYCRKQGTTNAAEEITLDMNAMAKGKAFLAVGVYEVSDDGKLLAFSTDETGFRKYTLYVKDLQTGSLLPEKIPHVENAVWAADNKTLFYVTEDDAKRPYRLWRHELRAKNDTLLYEETDALFALGIGRSRSKAYIFAESASKTSTEGRYWRATQPPAPF